MLRHSFFKAYILTPILSLLTIFVLPVKMYWDNGLFARMIFNPTTNIEQATHVLVKGKGGNIDICELLNHTERVAQIKKEAQTNPFYVIKFA